MAGGIATAGRKDIDDPCPWCWGKIHITAEAWTGGPDGYTAHVECWGCSMRGPDIPYVCETREEAERDALAAFRMEGEVIAEIRGTHTAPVKP